MEITLDQARGAFTNAVIAVYKENVTPTSFLRSFFPSVFSTTKYISFDVKRANEKVAVDILKGNQDKHLSFEEYIQSLKHRPNSDIIGCELVMEETRFPSEQDIIIEERLKTYLSISNETFYEVKEFIYKR